MISNIEIQPQLAADQGCSATFELIDSNINAHGWYNEYRFTAIPSNGWNFWKWIVTVERVEEGPGGQSGTFTSEHTVNTIIEYEAWDDLSYISGYGIWSQTITSVVAVFSKPSTGLILHSPVNLQILRGANGTILHDA